MSAVKSLKSLQQQPASRRHRLAEAIEERMNGPVTALGIVFLLLVLAETVIQPRAGLATAFTIASWVLWAVFATEFILRMVIAPSTAQFLKKNWWQIIFLVLPFFRFLRVLARLRALRAGRVISSATRTSRSTRSLLGGRVGWLLVLTVIVALSASQLLYVFASFSSYGDALHAALLATITGEPLGRSDGFSRVLDVVLSVYSVVVFASLAGIIGAYFLEADKRQGSVPDQP